MGVVRVGQRRPWPPGFSRFLDTFLAKKVVFLVSRRNNEILPPLAPLGKIFWATSGKIHYCPP